MKPTIAIASVLASLVAAGSAANIIVNGSFESSTTAITPDVASPAWGDITAGGTLSNWSISYGPGTTGIALANGDFGTSQPPYVIGNGSTIPLRGPTDGNTFVTLQAESTKATLTQGIAGLTAGTVDISFDWINMLSSTVALSPNNWLQVEVFNGTDATAPMAYNSGVIAVGNATKVTWQNTMAGPFTNTGTNLFVRVTINDGISGGQVGLDNIVMNHTPVPEPAAALLGSLSLLALFRRRR